MAFLKKTLQSLSERFDSLKQKSYKEILPKFQAWLKDVLNAPQTSPTPSSVSKMQQVASPEEIRVLNTFSLGERITLTINGNSFNAIFEGIGTSYNGERCVEFSRFQNGKWEKRQISLENFEKYLDLCHLIPDPITIDFNAVDQDAICQELIEKNRGQFFETGKGKKIEKSDLMQKLRKNGYWPAYCVQFGEEKLYFSKKNISDRHYLAAYTENGEIRLFYRSNSEGLRRSSDGLQSRNTLSKADFIPGGSYESTTMVDYRIGQYLDKIPEGEMHGDVFTMTQKAGGNNILKKSLLEQVRVIQADPKIRDAVQIYQDKSTAKAQEFFRNYDRIPLGGLYEKVDTYHFQHEYLGEIEVDVVESTYNGQKVHLHFAHSLENRPDEVFILKGDLVESPLNSFGIWAQQLNLWALTAKPIDYLEQLPYDHRFWGPKVQRFGLYKDIRRLYQELPIIRRYKEWKKTAGNA